MSDLLRLLIFLSAELICSFLEKKTSDSLGNPMSEFPALNKSTNPNLLLIVNALLENRKSSNLAIYKNKLCSNSCMTKNDTVGKQINYKGQCHEICCAPKTLPMATYDQDKTVLRICSFSRTIFSKSVFVEWAYT